MTKDGANIQPQARIVTHKTNQLGNNQLSITNY
jgi:hypothetical protein